MKTWRDRVSQAERRGKFTPDDRRLAASFRTCAVGEACEFSGLTLVRNAGHVEDDDLLELGLDFWRFTMQDNPKWAQLTLDKIEDRVLELKRDVT